MTNWSALIIGIIPSLIVGIVLAWFNSQQKKREERANQREKNRLKTDKVRISLLVASAKLSYAVAMAMKRGYTNGEVEDGVEMYKKAITEFKEFERDLMAQQTGRE